MSVLKFFRTFLLCLLIPAALDAEPPPDNRGIKVPAIGQKFKNSIGMEMVLIPAGQFKMGSPANEKDRDDDATQHTVKITKPSICPRPR